METTREYMRKPKQLVTIYSTFEPVVRELNDLFNYYSDSKNRNQLFLNTTKIRLKTLADRLFVQAEKRIKTDNNRALGNIKNSQTFMFPLKNKQILKIDYSKGDVRSMHLYDLDKNICYTLNQSVKKVEFTTAPYQYIHGVGQMDSNWQKVSA